MIEVLRWVVVVCSALAIIIGTPQWARWFRVCRPDVLQARLALAALNVAAGYGTAEAMWRGIPGGPRTYVVAVGTLWALYATAWHPVTDLFHRLRRTPDDHAD
jgi:hypothetical protein